MTDRPDPPTTEPAELVVPPDARRRRGRPSSDEQGDAVTSPAKVMRIGSMVKMLLEEVRAAPLDEPSRERLAEIYERSIAELSEALSPDLQHELKMLALPFRDGEVPDRGRDPRRQGPARRLAGGAVPRHPGDAVRPAAGRPPAARADPPAAARRVPARACPAQPGSSPAQTARARTSERARSTLPSRSGVARLRVRAPRPDDPARCGSDSRRAASSGAAVTRS